MARISENSINSLITDWGKDESNGLPYSGKAVLDFIKSLFINQLNETETKYGYSEFTDGALIFYDKEGGTELTKIQFSGTNYIVDFGTAKNLTVLTSDESYYLPITPKSYSIELGSTDREEVVEDYTFKIEVDTGKGFVDLNVQDNIIKYGTTKHVDIRKMLVVGVNRVRVIVTGVESKQSKAIVYTTTLTSLTLECFHTWNTVWFENKEYKINNIYFSGNVSKKLCVQIDDIVYETHFTANSEYKNVPYEFDVTGKLTSTESRIVPIKVWIESDNVKTKTYDFNVMFISINDPNKALVCINEVSNEVYNFELGTLFSYATYNLTELTININADLNGEIINNVIPERTLTNLQPLIKYKENLFLQINTEALDNLFINYTIYNITGTIPLNNSHAYLSEPGAVFYMNPSLRSNMTDDKEQWYNSADNSKINATWNKFTFADDAWLQDDNSNRAFVVKAGSNVSVDYKPFTPTTGNSKTFEFMFKSANIADYDTPILTVINKETFDINDKSCVGLVLYPTRLLIMTDNERQELFQLLLLSENRIIHLTVVVQRNYASNSATNLVRIFVNGCENVTFAIQNSSKLFIDSEFNNLRIGLQSSDFYLYMMRQYDKALSGQQIINNYLNALIETFEVSRKGIKDDNAILDGGAISYDICKQVGYNTYVIETDKEIPSLDNSNTDNLRVNILLEYNDHPEWNVRINNTPIDGQGTTSSKYAKWNLRNKVDINATWIYPNLENKTEKGKEGYIAGYGLNPKVSKITAKKNIASQPQGHKMGATSFYNDLFKKVLGEVYISENFPSSDVRVAVYQHPFMGFQKYSNGTYKFIGLYTIGPDKTDKKTFGYNEVEAYPNLMMIEGPNHDPLLTRFLIPWNEDVFYDNKQETLSIGNPTGEYQEGWDADIVGDFDTEKDNLLGLYEQEFKPAYDAVYFNSIYIASLSEANALNILDSNFNITEFQKKFTDITLPDGSIKTISNKLLSFYDSNYNLIYYRFKTGKYEILHSHNLLQYLNLTGTPTTKQIIEARCNQWKDKVGKYVSIYEACYHHCFCELIGASDNDAKNTYWRKFKSLVNGGIWGFQQDDLDTIFQNDNNGLDTKKYFAEHNDVNANGGDIFQGRTSAFWTTLREVCKTEILNTMHKIVEQALVLAEQFNLTASTKHETLFNLIKYYFWDHSAKYFPATAYNEDTQWGYIDVWYKDPSKLYNNVPPLTQIHGDHFETEYAWVEKRIAYIFSKYQIGAYEAQDGDGYGTLEFTCAEEYTLNVTPAIALYPRVSYGGALTQPSYRTLENENYSMTLQASGETALYIKGLDWLSDLGDLSSLKLSSRGGSTEIPFSVVAKRILSLNLGGNSPKFNCTNLKILSPSIEVLNAKNVSTLNTVVDLGLCPRIREIDLSGTKIPQVVLPAGGRIEKLYLPETINTLVLNNLQLLSDLQVEGYENIATLYCYTNNPIEVLNNVLNTENNSLKSVGIIWNGVITIQDSSLLTTLAKLTELVDGKYKYSSAYIDDSGTLTTDDTFTSPPNIQGTLYIDNYIYERDVEKLKQHLNNLNVIYNPDKLYVSFEDPEFEKLIVKTPAEGGYGDGIGVTQEQLDKVTSLRAFYRNSTIKTLNDLYKFRNLSTLGANVLRDMSLLEELNIPTTVTTLGASLTAGTVLKICIISSEKIQDLPASVINIASSSNNNTRVLDYFVIPNSVITAPNFMNTTNLKKLAIGDSITNIGIDTYTKIGEIYINSLKHWFEITSTTLLTTSSTLYLGQIEAVRDPNKGNQIDHYLWDKLEGTGEYKGQGTRVKVTTEMVNEALKEVTEIRANACRNMTQLEGELVIPDTITSIEQGAFYGCTNINKIEIPNSIEHFTGGEAFNHCSNAVIEDLNLPNLIEIGGGYNFANTKLKKISNLGSLTSIGLYVFVNCGELTSITIPTSVTSIGNNAFMNCTSLTSVEIPSSVTSIGYRAFGYCSSLTSITIPNSVTSIGNSAFQDCKNLSFVDFKGNVTSIDTAFLGTNVTTFICRMTVPPAINTSLFSPNVIYVPDESIEAYKTASGWSTFASRIRPIYTNTIPEEVELSITWNNTELTLGYISIPNIDEECTFDIIDSNATYNAIIDLENVDVVKIKGLANTTSPKLWCLLDENNIVVKCNESIVCYDDACIPLRVNGKKMNKLVINIDTADYFDTYVKTGVIDGYIKYTTIDNTLLEANDTSKVVYNEMVEDLGIMQLNTSTISLSLFEECTNLASINLPDNITTLGREAFRNCANLTDISLPEKLETMNLRVFGECVNLTSITIPNSVTSIDYEAFYNCVSLTSVTIPNSVTSIGDSAFMGCASLTSITIPNSVTSIGRNAFSYCTGLTSVTIPNSVTTIETSAFGECTLEAFTFEDTSKITSMTYIGKSIIKNLYVNDLKPLYKFQFRVNNANNTATNIYVNGELVKDVFIDYLGVSDVTFLFQGSTITSAKIAEGYTRANGGPFEQCRQIEWVDFPSTIQSIGWIRYMKAGVNLIVRAVTPPSAPTFFGTYGNIYVPDVSVEAYKTANNWSAFASIIRPLSDIEGITLKPLSGIVSKVLILKTLYNGLEVTPEYIINGTAATIENGVLTFSEIGEVTVIATYNGESVSRTYSWNGGGEFTSWEYNKAYVTNYNIGETFTKNYLTSEVAGWKCGIIPIDTVRSVVINGRGGTKLRLYCFTDFDNKVIKVAADQYIANNEVIDVPQNAAYLIVNIHKDTAETGSIILNY